MLRKVMDYFKGALSPFTVNNGNSEPVQQIPFGNNNYSGLRNNGLISGYGLRSSSDSSVNNPDQPALSDITTDFPDPGFAECVQRQMEQSGLNSLARIERLYCSPRTGPLKGRDVTNLFRSIESI